MDFPDKKYNIIYADPPWSYQDKNCSGSCENHYKTLSIKDLCDLPIQEIAAKDCVLFLWATYPLIKDALLLIDSWGFEYKSIAFQWIKKNKKSGSYFYGLGRWTRGNTEPCFLAVKGKPKRLAANVFQIIDAPIRQHSRKPDITRILITKLMGDLPRIELFSRERFEGWDVWGDQLPNDMQKVLIKEVKK